MLVFNSKFLHRCHLIASLLFLTLVCKPSLVYSQQVSPSENRAETEIKAYRVVPQQLDNLSNVLKQLYQNDPNVVITADAQRQLVVVAPVNVHQQISKFLERSGNLQKNEKPAESKLQIKPVVPSVKQENANHQISRDLGEGLVETELKLANINWQQVEKGTQTLLGKQLPVTFAAEGAIATFTLPTSDTRKVGMQVYRKDNVVILRGSADTVASWSRIIRAMDTPATNNTVRTSLVSLRNAKRTDVQSALNPLNDQESSLTKREVFETLKKVAEDKKLRWSGDMAAMIFQPNVEEQENGNQNPENEENVEEQITPENKNQVTIGPEVDSGLIGPVQIEFLEGLDVIVVKGHRRDVERIKRIINDIERLSVETQPVIKVHELLHTNSEAVAEKILELYDDQLSPRYGQVSITPLGRPNAILLIGREQSVSGIQELIEKLDQPVGPAKTLRVFQLSNISAVDAQTSLSEFYAEPTNLNTRIKVTADFRSNSLIVQASPRDMREIEYLIKEIDVPTSESELELRVFQLSNSLAEDLAPVLQEAISGQVQTGNQNNNNAQVRAAMLSFLTVDNRGGQLLKSGIMTEVQVTSDSRSNALLVRASPDSMELIGALIKHLDSQPSAESQIKVFTIINGDATLLVQMLEELFGQDQTNNQNQLGLGISGGESNLIPLSFSVDSRTNSIVASGSASDLAVVEAILLRLDPRRSTREGKHRGPAQKCSCRPGC